MKPKRLPWAIARARAFGYSGHMLKFMRDSSQSFLIYLMFGVLVFVFAVSFGPGGSSCDGVTQDYAAKVDGDIIRQQDFGLRFRTQMNNLRQSGAYGGGAGLERLQDIIRQQVIDQLVESRVMNHEADRVGLSVTDEELLRYLEEQFQLKDIEYADYSSWINRSFGTTVGRFEEQIRSEIAASKLQKLVTETVSVSESEVKAKFMRERNRAKVSYIRVRPPATTGFEAPSAEAVEELLASDMKKVEERFQRDSHKYRNPKEVQARQILKALPLDASDADVAKARGELLELKGQLDGGADFAALAQKHSDDEASKAKGGDLGFVKKGQMAREVVEKLYVMKKDAITKKPIRTRQGLHLLQVTAIKPPASKTLEEVKVEVARSVLLDQKAQQMAQDNANALLAQLQAGGELKELTASESEDREAREAAEEKGTPYVPAKSVRKTSAWILAGQMTLPGIGASPELHKAVFEATLEKPLIGKVYPVGSDYIIAKLTEREIPDDEKFEKLKEGLTENAIWEKRSKVLRSWVKHLKDQAQVDYNPAIFPQKQEG